MAANLFSNLDFHGLKFQNVNIDNADYTNKNILLIKDDLTDLPLLDDATKSAKVVGVTFLYVGDLVTKKIGGASGTDQNFKKNCIYRCTLSGTTYSWAEIELGGSSSWGVVNINPATGETKADLPSKDVKIGQQFRVASNGQYSYDYSAYDYDTSTGEKKEWANKGDFFFVSSVDVTGKNPVYTLISSGDDVYVESVDISSITAGTAKSIEFSLGTSDVAVAFYATGKEGTEGDGAEVEFPIVVSNYIVAKTAGDLSTNILKFTLDTVDGLTTLNDCKLDKIKVVIHRS